MQRMINGWRGEFSDWVGIDGFSIFDFLYKLSTGALTLKKYVQLVFLNC